MLGIAVPFTSLSKLCKNDGPKPFCWANQHVLTVLHPNLICRVTYWALVELLLHSEVHRKILELHKEIHGCFEPIQLQKPTRTSPSSCPYYKSQGVYASGFLSVEVMILLLMLTCIIMSSHVVCCQESPFISSESLIYAFNLGIYSLPSKSINQDNSRSSSNPELHPNFPGNQ